MATESLIGQELSEMLCEIESLLLELEEKIGEPPGVTLDGFRAGVKIASSVMFDKMWELQERERMPLDSRIEMVNKFGEEFKDLIFTYTGIDTHELYALKKSTTPDEN